jgi:hypothetical protein
LKTEQDNPVNNDISLKQIEALRNLGEEGRAAMVFQLSDHHRDIVESGIRHRHPDYTGPQVIQAYLSLILDRESFENVFPGCRIKP